MHMKKQDTPALTLEKQTLTAWARILYNKGMIDNKRLEKMITLIDRLNEPPREKKAG